ncbi:MAG: prolipoprotein diacylglyceryl transferase [Bacteroidales bacterium]
MIDFPARFVLFDQEILWHTVLEALGIFLGMRYYFYLRRKSSTRLPFTISLFIVIGATGGALIGSKLIGNLEHPEILFNNPFSLKRFWMNNTIIGGLSFGLIGVELIKKAIGHKESTGDLMVFPLMLAMIVGRVGCFVTGVYEETYGVPTNSIFGMYLGDEYRRHPVALYEIVFLIVLWIAIAVFKKKHKYESGRLFQIFMLCYFGFRFVLDFIKPRYELFWSLGTIQIVCIVVIIYYLYLIFMRDSKK